MEKPLALNYIGGREAVLKRIFAISRTRSIPKEKVWDRFSPKRVRVRSPHALGCMCPSCEHTMYQMLELSRE